MSRREEVLAALFARLQTVPGAEVLRNVAWPELVPAGGLIIMGDGEPGEPDVTLNPRTEYYNHRVTVELFVNAMDGGEAALDALITAVAAALKVDRALGGLVENIYLAAPVSDPTTVGEGGAPFLAAEEGIIVEYLVSDPLAA